MRCRAVNSQNLHWNVFEEYDKSKKMHYRYPNFHLSFPAQRWYVIENLLYFDWEIFNNLYLRFSFLSLTIKTFSAVFYFDKHFWYLHIHLYCRKFNAEFNKSHVEMCIHIMNPKKQAQVYVTVLLFFLYSIYEFM